MPQPVNDTATGGHAPLETVLELILVTYNRSASLDNTLRQLAESPFARCRITVLDNCSTDDTAAVTAFYRDKFPDFYVIRHPRNIGGDYNFLRAIEISTHRYTWIVCDDDNYDFTHADEVVSAITICKYDLIYVASRSSIQLNCKSHGETTVKCLVLEGAHYHRGCTFWPALIFQSNKYDNYCFHAAPNIFPSIKFINRSLVEDFSIYVAEYPLVIRSETSASEVDPLEIYKAWVTNAALIKNFALRANVIEQHTVRGFFISLAFWIAVERSKKASGYWKRLFDILFAVTPLQKMKLLLLLPVMIIPLPLPWLIRTRGLVYRLMGNKDASNLPPVESVQR